MPIGDTPGVSANDVLSPRAIFHEDPASEDRPKQVLWAKLDHTERPLGSVPIAVLDCIDSEWFAGARSSEAGWLTHAAESGEHVSIVTTALDRLPGRQRWYQITLEAWRERAEAQTLSELAGGSLALQSGAVLGAQEPRLLVDFRPATREEAALLGLAGSLAGDRDASAEVVSEILGRVDSVTSAAVYDVGQGNWNALLHEGIPVLLFDIGGGIRQHIDSFPTGFRSFCFARKPPVVLSHWDWDHWSSAVRFPQAQRLPWIVPRQGSLGPVHARFVAALRGNGGFHVFPKRGRVLANGIEIRQGAAPLTNFNESGLGLLVHGPGRGVFLFPGDAGYKSLNVASMSITSLVVPHHGGRSRSSLSSRPKSDGSAAGRAVFSYADPNHYGHPLSASVALHRGWATATLDTAHRRGLQGPAHVELHWTTQDPQTPGCRGACPLPLLQR
jgi:hypothetical protein